MAELFTIFWSFLKIGAFTFGGGYAMIPLIQHEVINRRGWLTEREFLDLLTLAQAAPGPIDSIRQSLWDISRGAIVVLCRQCWALSCPRF